MTAPEYQALVDLLIADEGMRLKPYEDTAGKISIGVGRNLTDTGITALEASYLLDHDIARALESAHTFAWFPTLDPVRQRVILSMLFNLGFNGFTGFRHLIAAMARRHYDAAAGHMLDSHWHRQVGKRAERLAQMMREGDGNG